MKETLIKLKRLLNSIPDEELKEMELWIDNDSGVDLIGYDDNAITLITNKEELEINGLRW